MEQAIDVDRTVRHAAHPGVPGQVLDLVQVQRPRHQSLERRVAPAADQGYDPLLHVRNSERLQRRPKLGVAEVLRGEALVGGQARLFERV
jgi:hypothetical protein